MQPPVVVDAILAKYNVNTKITDAPVVVAMGPGFTAGEDCHAVIETMRGHSLGRVILEGSIPSPANPPSGCKFHTRCKECMEICKHAVPDWQEVEPGHFCACHLYNTPERLKELEEAAKE